MLGWDWVLVLARVHRVVGAGLVPALAEGGHRALPYIMCRGRILRCAQDDRGVGGHRALSRCRYAHPMKYNWITCSTCTLAISPAK